MDFTNVTQQDYYNFREVVLLLWKERVEASGLSEEMFIFTTVPEDREWVLSFLEDYKKYQVDAERAGFKLPDLVDNLMFSPD